MHDTLNSKVKGTLDSRTELEDKSTNFVGWTFHVDKGILPLRARDKEGLEYDVTYIDRPDVGVFYKHTTINACGWKCNIPAGADGALEMLIDEKWAPIFEIKGMYDGKLDSTVIMGKIPSFVVADNVYKNPDSVRAFALKQTFSYHPDYHKGKRTEATHKFAGLKERFEELLGCKITNWDKYGVSGCFQYCIAGDQLVYHADFQQYAGVLFLTPDAPPECGTTFYRSKNTKKMKAGPGEYPLVYPHGHLDSTDFDVVDVVGNVYNRIVLFDAQFIHAATCYFGNSVENGRLFQLFFFDLEKPS